MDKHTPGPWKIAHAIQDDAARYIWSATDRATGHRELVASIPYASGDHINADARLIASAPLLLEALQDLLSATEETYDSRHEREAALAAIAKATGGEA